MDNRYRFLYSFLLREQVVSYSMDPPIVLTFESGKVELGENFINLHGMTIRFPITLDLHQEISIDNCFFAAPITYDI